MKRRIRLIYIGCATVGGTFLTLAAAQSVASAAPSTDQQAGEHITVQSGETLSAIGARTSRTWPQLAAYNGIADPNLIYAGEVITIPPASYAPTSVTTAATPPAPSTSGASDSVSSSDSVSTSPASSSDPASTSDPVSTSSPAPATGAPSGVFSCIAAHESGGNPGTNTGNGYYGMYQDTQSSWVAGGGLAYAPRADEASAAAQTIVNEHIQAQQGWGAWPVSSGACGV